MTRKLQKIFSCIPIIQTYMRLRNVVLFNTTKNHRCISGMKLLTAANIIRGTKASLHFSLGIKIVEMFVFEKYHKDTV